MAAVTKYICDRCEASQDTPNQMWTIALHVHHEFRANPRYHDHEAKNIKLWCRRCCDEFGLVNKLIRAEGDFNPPPTLEDIIRQLVTETIQNQD